jgi:hypothetical protein
MPLSPRYSCLLLAVCPPYSCQSDVSCRSSPPWPCFPSTYKGLKSRFVVPTKKCRSCELIGAAARTPACSSAAKTNAKGLASIRFKRPTQYSVPRTEVYLKSNDNTLSISAVI